MLYASVNSINKTGFSSLSTYAENLHTICLEHVKLHLRDFVTCDRTHPLPVDHPSAKPLSLYSKTNIVQSTC